MAEETDRGAMVRTETPLIDKALAPANAEQLWYSCQRFAKGGVALPDDLKGNPDACFTVAVIGGELGLGLMQSLQNISIIKGKATLPGVMISALVRNSPNCQDYNHGFEGSLEDGTRLAWVVSKRHGADPERTEYTLDDAKRADLYVPGQKNRDGSKPNWLKNTDDMLHWKAVARDGRRNWGDVLLGLAPHEDFAEATDAPPVALKAEVVGAEPQAAPDPAMAALEGEEAQPEPAPIVAPPPDSVGAEVAEPSQALEDVAEEPLPPADEPDPFGPEGGVVCAKCGLDIARGDATVDDETGTFHEGCHGEETAPPAEGADQLPDAETVQPPSDDGLIGPKKVSTLKAEITKRSKKFLPQHQGKVAKMIAAAVCAKAKVDAIESMPEKFYEKALNYIQNAKVDPSA